MKNLNFFEKLWEHSRTLRRVGLVLVMCLIAIPQMWALKSTFTKGETMFIIGDSKASSAWNGDACVKAWFNVDGSGGAAASTNWLVGGDSENKVFWTIVPAESCNRVQLQRFESNCSTWKNSNGDIYQSGRSKDAYNTFYSNGDGTSNCGWKNETYAFHLRTDVDSWASDVATFVDKGDGYFQCTYTFTSTSTQQEFKIRDSRNHWYGRQSDGNNYVLNGLTNGTSYTVVASFNIQDCSGGNKTSLSVVTVHKPGVYVSASGYNKTLKSWANGLYEWYGVYNGSDSDMRILASASSSNTTGIAVFSKSTISATQWLAAKLGGRTNTSGTTSCEFSSMGNNAIQVKATTDYFEMCVQGYDSLRLVGKDVSNNSGQNKYLQVKINGVDKTSDNSLSSSASIRKYKLDPTTPQYIRIHGSSAEGGTIWGFSLRPSKPTITASSLSGATYYQGDASTNLSVTASPVVAGATLTYQWYSNTSASTSGGTIVDGATSATFAPPTDADAVGTTYYYCVVSEAGCNSATSSASGAIEVVAGGCTDVAAPTELTCSAQTKNTLTFTWTKAAHASGYVAKLWTNSSCTGEATKTQVLADLNSVTFNSLSAGTTYYCKVQSKGDGEIYCESGGTTSAQSATTKTVHSISFNVNGGSGSLTTISDIEYGSSQTLTAIGSNITRSGWTFTGWNTNKYGTGTPYADQATVASVTSNITLYAQWEKTVYLYSKIDWWYNAKAWYAIYYWDNSATSNDGYVTMELADCEEKVYKATLPGNGYTHLRFLRMNPDYDTPSITTGMWNKTEDYAYPTSNPLFTINASDAVTCTGSWGTYSEPKYTITFASNGADGGTAMTNVTNIACEGDVDLVANTWTKSGNTFANWKTNVAITADGSAVAANGAVADEASITDITSNITLTAQWTPNNYDVAAHTLSNVTLSSGGSTGTGVATWGTNYTATFAAADGYTLPASITVTIGGNSTTAGTEYTWTQGTGTVVVNGAYITGNVAITVAGIIKKTVTYKKNGGASGADGSVTGSTTDASSPYAHGSTVTTIANGFTNAGYKFKWWNTAYDGSGEDFYVGEKFDITANTNLFAQWEEIGTGEEFWVGSPNVWHVTEHDVTVGGMNIKPQDYSSNNNAINKDFTGSNKAYTIVNATEKRAIVMAVGASDKYVEISFTDGSTINELEVGVAAKDGTDPTMAVLYSTTSDFSSGLYYLATPVIPTIAQTSKQVTTVNPDVEDTYKYVRIYSKILTAVYSQTGGSGNKIRIYSIKAKKGSSCTSLDAPEGLSCTAQTKNSLTFGWSAVTNASSYDVYLYSDEDCTAEVTPTEGKPYNVTGTSATLTGLDGGTTYYCKVRTKGNGTTYCTNGGITTTAASGKTKYGVTYSKGSATSGTAPTDGNSYAVDAEVTVKDTTGCKFVYASHTFRGWTDGTTFYKVGQTFRMPNENVTLTAVWDSYSAGAEEFYWSNFVSSPLTANTAAKLVSKTTESYITLSSITTGNSTRSTDEATGIVDGSSYSLTSSQTSPARCYIKLTSGSSFNFTTTADFDIAIQFISESNDEGGIELRATAADGTLIDSKIVSSKQYKFQTLSTTSVAAGTYYVVAKSKTMNITEILLSTSGSGEGWTNKYVAFGANEGVVGTPSLPDTIKGVPSGKKIVQPADPTATGYIFDNWYPTQACNTSAFDWTGTITKDTTLYAKFNAPTTLIQQPAKVAGKRVPMDTLDAYRHPEDSTVIVHQLISPTPYGTCNISYKLCYSNHVQLDEQPVIHYGTGAGVGYDTVWMPMEQIQKYELVAYLRTDATRGEGDLVTTDTAIVSVENRWPIKVRYMKDGVELREPTQWYAYPSFKTTEAIRIPAERNGYILDSLEYGVGITVDSAKYIDYISSRMYQVYLRSENASTVTAHYKVAPNTVYFFDTFEDLWYTPYIFDYGTTGYWDTGLGAGANEHLGTHATRIDFMDRMYMMPIGASTTKLAIGSDEQKDDKGKGFDHFYSRTYTPEGWDHSITVKPEIFYRTDFNQALPMFVPVVKSSSDYYIENTEARYFRGFWVKYSPDRDSTGYYLKVYDRVDVVGATLIQSIPMTLTQTGEDGTWELTATMDLEAGKTYGFKYTKATGASTVDWYGNNETMTSANHTDWTFTTGTNNCGLTTTSAGDYTFHLHCVNYGTKAANTATDSEVQGKMVMTVDYATNDGDYRVVYVDDAQTNLTVGKSNVEPIASQSIRARANGQDTVTFFIRKDAMHRSMKFQKFNGSTGAWDDVASGTIDLTNTAAQTFTVSTDTTYQIYLQQNADGTGIEATGMDYYSGLYYIRTDCVDEHKWDYKQSMEAHSMVESDYASHLATDPFTHYFVHWVDKNKNVKFVVATQYSPTLTDTLITDDYANVAGGNLPNAGASVRFMYNKSTNDIKRAYLAGANGALLDPNFLKLTESNDPTGYMKNTGGEEITSITFTDLGNFSYQASIKAKPGLKGKLTAVYNSQTQYFKGSADTDETILGGTGESWQNIVMTYDFKTNRLICAWTPGDTIDESMSINADIMIIRRGQRDAEQIVFKTNESKLTDVKYIYGVIELNYTDLVGMMYSWDWWSYEHCVYYISFPFDVLVNDITGVGKIGVDWRIQRYNGAKRAEKGWFIDGEKTFWEDVHAGDTLHAYEGYNLMLARTRFNDSRNAIWENKTYGDKVYLFFPSLNATTGIISDGEVTVHVPAHECKKDQTFVNSYGMLVNHKVTDSHWNMLGTPLFENKTASSIQEGPTIGSETLQYLYAWNSAGNTLGIRTTLSDTWKFKTMYSYMVQYTGDVVFQGSTVNKIVAAKRNDGKKHYQINLELSKEERFVGRTYVELRENAVDSFLLNEDISMLRNGVDADIFTNAGGYEAAANVLTIASHTVPVGLYVKNAGTYTFSMPEDFDGEVILVDTYHQTRTNLAIDDYEIALPKGDIADRFYLEININKTPTAIDGVDANQGALKDGKAHKFIENDLMYILKDGVLYDARGNRVK